MLYAIGTQGNAVRVYIDTGLLDMRYQVRTGEVAVPLAAQPVGAVMISADGGSVAPLIAVQPASPTVSVSQIVTMDMPAGATWRAGGLVRVGPGALSFASPGQYPVEMTGAYTGRSVMNVMPLDAYEAYLVGAVKDEGERRSMLAMSPGGSKKTKYAAKAAEVENWNSLGGIGALTSTLLAAFNGLSTTVRNRKFRFAIKDAKFRGDQVQNAIARFTAGADSSLDEVARLEGIEQASVDKIKAAATGAAKLAAYAAINWSATA